MTARLGRRPLIAAALAAPFAARAQGDWPNRPIRVVISWPPGGGADIPMRLAAPAMQQVLGQALVLENRAGASGSVGAGVVAQATPDGYTALADTAGGAVNHLLIPGLPYDFAKALTPVSQMVVSPLLCVVRADHPARTLPELLERLRKAPGRIPFASSGVGTATHLAPALLLRRAGVTANHVPYRGGAASVAGILAGDAEFVFSTLPQAAPLAQEGRLRGLAVSIAHRLPNLPEVPTVQEQGFPDFDVADWLGFYVPAGTPAPIIDRLAEAAQAGMRDPNAVKRLGELGMIPVGSSPAAFSTFWQDQRSRLGAIIQAEGIKVE
ncbi:Bug family tripartite tricarboxylate transporter substrate binding protein [Paracraurococcus lichenis]|uniref:Tripartite tricarboxylate transporter substrate-binding protein n=1 Tax=Paracraurococcus lichenis TaxID=3064888 RepID=A0ABT9DU08_9PROT|nr:tripartite tricarboxylate transporter substrate-binding protein [Paracraurococcus sp. LOR1-02]MDO9707393.1 tripartite tricarboxylate transporter substrate-binding protein [Paracraurococcus sp. LOR1-02]